MLTRPIANCRLKKPELSVENCKAGMNSDVFKQKRELGSKIDIAKLIQAVLLPSNNNANDGVNANQPSTGELQPPENIQRLKITN